jgi:ATP synthase F1 delta subunit
MTKKIVTNYSKSLFLNVLEINNEMLLGNMSPDWFIPTIYIIGEELILIRSLFVSSKKIKDFFTNPTNGEQQKVKAILTMFPGLSRPMRAFLKVLAERSLFAYFPEIVEEYTNILLRYKNCTQVKIITATTLSERYGLSLLNTLKNITASKDVIIQATYNPKLLGGIIIEYNSISVDASVLNEFNLFINDAF